MREESPLASSSFSFWVMRTQDGLKTKCHSEVVLMSVRVPRPLGPWVTCALGYTGSDLRSGLLLLPQPCCLACPRLTKAHMTVSLSNRTASPSFLLHPFLP